MLTSLRVAVAYILDLCQDGISHFEIVFKVVLSLQAGKLVVFMA